MNLIQQQIQTAFAAMLALLAGFSLTLVGCRDKKPQIDRDRPGTVGEKIEDKINDGLDRRPGEPVRDAVEDAEEAAEEAGERVNRAVE